MFAGVGRVGGGMVAMVVAALAAALVLGATVGTRGAEAAFPGTNGKIVFQSGRAGNNIHVMDANATTNDEVNLTNSDGHSDPAYSPDGSRIAFVSGGSSRGYDIFVMNADGSGRQQVTDTGINATGRADSNPTWSPDGTQIAFVANNAGPGGDGSTDREIWMVNADGSGRTLLTNNTSDDYYPAWSPLGDQIAYVNHTDRNIYVMDTDPATSGSVNLTPSSPTGCSPTCYQGDDEDPAWSPDGSRIAYVHGYGTPTNPNAGGGVPNIWVMDANGANKTNVSDDSANSAVSPAWSPDGTKIAYVGTAAGTTNRNISVMDASGANKTPLDTSAANDINPDWQPVPEPPRCDLDDADGDNTVIGTDADETICGLGGNDFIDGGGGDDVLMGGTGNDTLVDPSGRATLNGGDGNDTASFAGSTTSIEASLLTGYAQRVDTNPLEVAALVSIEGLIGSDGDDRLEGSDGKNTIVGGDGADELLGLGSNDKINSRDGVNRNDTINAGKGKDRCVTDRKEADIRGCE